MPETVRVGVIGTGIGVAHIEALRQTPGAEVVAVCSAQAARAQAVAARFNIPRATDDYHELLDAAVDAVVIATPPALHARQGLDAIAAGKHVFCEKPLATSLDEARALRDAARQAGIVHAINFQMRFTPPFARAAELVRDGYLGRLVVADARITMNPIDYLQSPHWSTSKAGWFTDAEQAGGLLAGSAGPHLIDLLLWYGGPIVAVAAQAAVTRPVVPLAGGATATAISAEDVFLVLARFADGGLATGRGVPVVYHQGGFSLELNGVAGTLAIAGGVLHGATAQDQALAPLPAPTGAPHDRVAIASRFIAAIRDGGPAPAPNFEDGVAVQAVLAAIRDAASSEQWIAVPKD